MPQDPAYSFDEQNISIGACYAISLNGKRAFVKVLDRIAPNSQGVVGPTKWIGERVGACDAPDQEGQRIEVTHFDLNGRATRREMVVQAIHQGFESDKDIYDYVQSCGVEIPIKTVSAYKSMYHNGTLFNPKMKHRPRSIRVAVPQALGEITAAALTIEICRLAKKVGGLKTLGQTVESLRQAMESLK